ncbi:MAG: hypothetical protein LH615_16165, partial [Ferruginibacter sp.]|nr:hypothetical protein [Ferruginibacter sp.]
MGQHSRFSYRIFKRKLRSNKPLTGRRNIEPVRSILIPGFDDVKRQCKEAGALGGGISGSGPSIFMF